jgi:PKD repeat protein
MNRHVGLVAGLLLFTVGWAGCFGSSGGGGGGAQDAPNDGAQGASDNGTAGGGPQGNAADVAAAIRVSFNGTALEPSDGAIGAEAGANLTFDGSGSAGTNLTFAWDLGDGTTATEPTVVHAYGQTGLFNVTLSVSDGQGSAKAGVSLNVTAAGPAAGEPVGTDRTEFSGTLVLGNPNAAMVPDVDHVDHTVTIGAATAEGAAGLARTAVISVSSSDPGAVTMYVYWRSPEGSTLAETSTDSGEATLSYDGEMAPGDYVVRVRLFAGAQASYSGTADVTFVAS